MFKKDHFITVRAAAIKLKSSPSALHKIKARVLSIKAGTKKSGTQVPLHHHHLKNDADLRFKKHFKAKS